MAAGYKVKCNIIFYELTKYFSVLTSRFSTMRLWFNSCHLGEVLARPPKNTPKHRYFHEHQMHKLPRLNSCLPSFERKCYTILDGKLSYSYRQPFLRIVSVDIMTTIDTRIIEINVSMFTTIFYLLLDTIGWHIWKGYHASFRLFNALACYFKGPQPFEGATGGLRGGHRWIGGPPVAYDE